jgi:hypothetical protein
LSAEQDLLNASFQAYFLNKVVFQFIQPKRFFILIVTLSTEDKAPQSILLTFGNFSSKNKNHQKNLDITGTGISILFPNTSCQAESSLKFFLKQEFPDTWNGNVNS